MPTGLEQRRDWRGWLDAVEQSPSISLRCSQQAIQHQDCFCLDMSLREGFRFLFMRCCIRFKLRVEHLGRLTQSLSVIILKQGSCDDGSHLRAYMTWKCRYGSPLSRLVFWGMAEGTGLYRDRYRVHCSSSKLWPAVFSCHATVRYHEASVVTEAKVRCHQSQQWLDQSRKRDVSLTGLVDP